MIGTPGIHDGIPELAYHAHKGSLSVSGAKVLIGKSPAHFRYQQDHGRAPKAAFDLGHATHTLVLGRGAEFTVVDAEDWRTKAAREQRDEAYAAGRTPLLQAQYEQAQAMALAIRSHPLAAALFDPSRGKPEQSGYFLDEPTGILRRFRLDWLPESDGGRLLVPDLKTTVDASPKAISKAMANFAYAAQSAWYLDGLEALQIAEECAFLFVFVEKEPPHVVTVAQPSEEVLAWGRKRNREALDLYARCLATDTWPGYSSDVVQVGLPKWATYEEDAA